MIVLGSIVNSIQYLRVDIVKITSDLSMLHIIRIGFTPRHRGERQVSND